jgi:hypothetical protein
MRGVLHVMIEPVTTVHKSLSDTVIFFDWTLTSLFRCTPSILIYYWLHSQSQSQCQCYVMTDGQSASLSWCQAPVWGLRPDFYYCQKVAGLLMWDAVSDERTGMPFTTAAGPRQRSHSWVRVSRDSWPYFTVSDSRLPQPGGSGPCIYIPTEQGDPVIPPGTGFPFRHLLRLAELRWRYSTPPPYGIDCILICVSCTIAHQYPRKTPVEHLYPRKRSLGFQESTLMETCLSTRSLAMGLYVTIEVYIVTYEGLHD